MHKIIFIIFLLFRCSTSYSQSTTKPQVLIITTGGTIASKTNAPSIEGHDLIKAVPELSNYGTIEIDEFVNIGSSKMTPLIWLPTRKPIVNSSSIKGAE
jgi:L-asparaginase